MGLSLCTKDQVKDWMKKTTTDDDRLLETLVLGISGQLCAKMPRLRASQPYLNEHHESIGAYPDLLLFHGPVTSIEKVVDLSTVLDPSAYTFEGTRTLVRVTSDGLRLPWGRGQVFVDYTGGYTEIPAEIQFAAIKQVVYDFGKTGAGRKNLGVEARSDTAGESVTYNTDAILPEVMDVVDTFNRRGF